MSLPAAFVFFHFFAAVGYIGCAVIALPSSDSMSMLFGHTDFVHGRPLQLIDLFDLGLTSERERATMDWELRIRDVI